MATIEILEDVNSEMICIVVDGGVKFEGNFWDIPQGGSGLSDILDLMGVEHTLGDYEYDD